MVRIACIVLTLCLAAPAVAAAPKRPRGTYSSGERDTTLLSVTGDTMPLAAFTFRCQDTTGRTSVNGIAIERRRGRYRFATRLYISITYGDGQPDENGRMQLKGSFTPDARRATGTLSVTSKRCGSTGKVAWSARRSKR